METTLHHTTPIPIARPTLVGDELARLEAALASGWVSMGPVTQQFEAAVCDYTGSRFAVAVNSCTSAIHLAMLVHGIGRGDEVICPSYSFIATANGVMHAGAQPQFADIDPDTLNLCPQALRRLIADCYVADETTGTWRNRTTGNTLKGILLVHQIGIPGDIDAFRLLAEEFNLVLMEDNACGLGSTYKNAPLGSSGLTGMLSFHPRKVITTGEGGMLLIGDETLAEKARVLRAHGMSLSDLARHASGSTTFEAYHVVGYNYRLNDLQASLGLSQMEALDSFIERRRVIAAQYDAAFSGLPGVSVIQPPAYVTRWNVQSYPIRLLNATVMQRNALMQALDAEGIATRRGIPPIHREPVYAENADVTLPHAGLPNTEAVSAQSVFLPIFPTLRDEDVARVIEAVRRYV
ncbi:MAG: DegT/DnrJ/EryC1/StrS family aminotransferase [Candidatus Melainabacteria bacterium]